MRTDSVTVAWETAAEVANAGFNVYRSVSADALGEMVNGALIAGYGVGWCRCVVPSRTVRSVPVSSTTG